jgi:probable HAF family extracellular repeat protein
VFIPINFPLATSTTAYGINDTGEIAGFYSDAAGDSHGFIYTGGAFSTVDVAGARSTLLTRIKNGGLVTGVCYDALNEGYGITGLLADPLGPPPRRNQGERQADAATV